MSNIYPIYTDRVRYKLTQNPTGQQIVEEPSGFRNDDNEFIRDKSFHGIFPQMTNNLTFYNQGGLYITAIYNDFGINADLILTKEERNPKTDIWELVYTGFLDFSTYSRKDEGVSIKFVSSGLLRVIKARESEKIELDRLDTLKGNEIPYLEPSQVALGGRNIQLNSLLETEKELAYTTTPISSSPGLRMLSMRFQTKSTRTATIGYPMTVTYVSDISVNQFVGGNLSQTTTPTEGRQQAMFYAVSEKDTTLQLKIKYNFNIFKGNTYLGGQSDIKDLSNASMHLRLTVYENGTDYDFKEVVIDNLTPNLISGSNFTTALQSGDFEYDLQLLKGESASLEFYARATRWGDFIGSIGLTYGNLRASFQNMTGSIEIIRDSQYEPSLSKIHFPFNVANRFLKLFTEQDDLLVSNVLGKIEDGYEEDGEASLIAMAHGFWIRGFSKDDGAEITDENRYKSMTTSFKDFYQSYFDVWNLGAGIEKVGFKETFRIEKLGYFYNRNILIRLGQVVDGTFEYVQVNNVKRTLNKKSFISGLDIGYTQGGDYEEAIGLDEYNTRTTLTTIIDKVKSSFKAVSGYRADSYGAEFARRKPYVTFPTEDTKYDNSIWIFDLIRNVNSAVFNQRLWQDDFSEEPTGVFSPATAQNLRLSPFNILLRHGWFIGTGLVKYPLDFIRYGSSVANSALTTKLKIEDYPQYGGVAHSENGNIQNSDLETARMDGEIIEFEFNVDYDLLQKIQGKTVILGKEVQNFYGLVAFMNENGEIEEGYLEKISPSGVGKWTLNKFNR
tara:strand:+ start:147 stop:2498 length:2352 start_codon:yes stop_codon:yes gene_type:complete